MKNAFVMSALSILMFGSLQVNAASGHQWTKADVDQYMAIMGNLKGIKALPGTGFAVAEGAGETFMISADGRFVMRQVEVLDTWNGKVIRNLQDTTSLDRIDFTSMKLKLDELLTFTVGNPKSAENVIFIDPRCGYCKGMIEQVKKMQATHRFRIVVAPILGEESIEIAKRLTCMDRAQATAAILNNSYQSLPATKEGCDTEPMSRALIVARLLGRNAVPFVVSSTGDVHRGFVKDLQAKLTADLTRATAR